MLCSQWEIPARDKCIATLDRIQLLNFSTTAVISAVKNEYMWDDLGFAIGKVNGEAHEAGTFVVLAKVCAKSEEILFM